ALLPRHERHDGLSRHDGGAAGGTAPGAEADRITVPALRSDGEPLSEDPAGCGVWGRSGSSTRLLGNVPPRTAITVRVQGTSDGYPIPSSSTRRTKSAPGMCNSRTTLRNT